MSNSVILVLGETSKSREHTRQQRVWKLWDNYVQEVDEQKHLGILRPVFNCSVHNTNERCSAGRSAFYALNAVGSRFGSLHPITSFRLYQSLCLPVLLYSAEISMLSNSEVTIMERVHRKILRAIQGLPVRCKSSSLSPLLGSLSVPDLITHRKLSFVISLVNLDDDSLAKQVLRARLPTAGDRSLIACYRDILSECSLPDMDSLLSQPFKPSVWNKSTKKQLLIRSSMHFLDDCEI